MLRLSLKPDSSFFRKIVVGAVGARAVCEDLAHFGHDCVELERGSTDSKLWKDIKRKRVRIPDLVCRRCGQRVECRSKTKAELAMVQQMEQGETVRLTPTIVLPEKGGDRRAKKAGRAEVDRQRSATALLFD